MFQRGLGPYSTRVRSVLGPKIKNGSSFIASRDGRPSVNFRQRSSILFDAGLEGKYLHTPWSPHKGGFKTHQLSSAG